MGSLSNITLLSIHKDIAAEAIDKTENFIPTVGKFTIQNIEGNAAFDLNCYVGILWDDVLIWHTKGSINSDKIYTLIGDGVKKIEVILSASDMLTGSVVLGLDCRVVQKS